MVVLLMLLLKFNSAAAETHERNNFATMLKVVFY